MIYMDNGYLNAEHIINKKMPFNILIGGRGIGKTYNMLKWAIDHDVKILLVRRMQTQIEVLSSPELSPYKILAKNMCLDIVPRKINKQSIGFYLDDKCICVMVALSTFANMRGFDGSDINMIIYDEFIPEAHERPIKKEDEALNNLYETVNRNRELEGRPPCYMYLCSNSNDLGNVILMSYGVILRILRMQETGQEECLFTQKGLGLWVFQHSPISEAKADTALYRLTAGTDFARMSIQNEFNYDDGTLVRSLSLAPYAPVVTYGELTFYRHKFDGTYYVSGHRSGSCPSMLPSANSALRCRRSYMAVFLAYLKNTLVFEDMNIYLLFKKYFAFK